MVYRFVVLSDEDDTFLREFEFLENQTLLDFHNSLQEELEFDKSQMASFFMASDNWEKEDEFTLLEMGPGTSTMEKTLVDDVILKKNQKLLYLFDFFNDRSLFIECTGTVNEVEGKEYPVCNNSKGVPPKQILFGKSSGKRSNPLLIPDEDDDNDIEDLYFDSDDEENLDGFSTESADEFDD